MHGTTPEKKHANSRKSMNRLSRGGRVWARSMKRKELEAKSWEQRSCGVGKREWLGRVGSILIILVEE